MPRSRIIVVILLASFVASTALAASAPTARAASRTFVIEMKDIRFHPTELRADWGDEITIRVYNNETGDVGHTFDIVEFNVHIGSRASPLVNGTQGMATFTANRNGTFWFFCDIPGHAFQSTDGTWSGMAGRLIVGQESAVTDPTPIIVGGVVVLAVTAGVAVYAARRKR